MKIVGFLICGPGEADKYLDRTLDNLKELCDEVVVTFNNVDKKTRELVESYKFITREDDREWGKAQPKIKTDALKFCRQLNPDWIVALDADEVIMATRKQLEELANRGGIGWYFYIVNLWNDEQHYANGLSFWNIRFYKFEPKYGLNFLNKPVHCGLAPPIVYKWGNYAPYVVEHRGLMNPKDRAKKVKRYEKYDPQAQYKSDLYYQALKVTKNGVTYDPNKMNQRVREEVRNYKMKTHIVTPNEEEGYVFVTKDGRTIDVPKKELRRYERMGWKVREEVEITEVEVEAEEEVNELTCVICGKETKSKAGLSAHKRSHN